MEPITTTDNLIKQKCQEYREYIAEHIENVSWAFNKLTKILSKEEIISQDIINELEDAIIHHDRSKYSTEEFGPYRKRFYPINSAEKQSSEKEFEAAWEHHYMLNDHHSEYWRDSKGNPKKMSEVAALHMICDQMAMSKKFGSSPKKWYYENKSKLKLHSETEEYVDMIYNILEP